MDDGGDNDDVGKDLKVGLQKIIVAELIVNQKEQADDVPQNDRLAQITDGSNVGRIGQLVNGIVDGKDKTDNDETDLDDPGEPILDFISEDHKAAETRNSPTAKRVSSFEFRVSMPQPASFPIKLNSGRYMEITTPPTTTPRIRMIIGSMAVSKSPTAASTSSS